MKNVEIKKSDLALFKGLGMDLEQMTAKISHENGVEVKKSEVKNALDHFGLTKTRGEKKESTKAYQIMLIDDVGETSTLNMDSSPETKEEVPVTLDSNND